MQDILDSIVQSIKDALLGMLEENLSSAFSALDQRIGKIGDMVSQTPEGFNGTIYSFITGLCDTVIVPIAGLVITYVLVYELISMVMDKNNFHDFDSSLFFRYLGKACIAVVLVSHTQEIVEALFEVGSSLATTALGSISNSTNLSIDATIGTMIQTQGATMTVGQLIKANIETGIINLAIRGLGLYVTILMYSRFVEIYLYMSIAPVPFATMTNREWGQIGTNYLRGLLALAFQAFLIMACVGIYAALISGLNVAGAGSFNEALDTILVFTFMLAIVLGKTSSISKSIFNTH